MTYRRAPADRRIAARTGIGFTAHMLSSQSQRPGMVRGRADRGGRPPRSPHRSSDHNEPGLRPCSGSADNPEAAALPGPGSGRRRMPGEQPAVPAQPGPESRAWRWFTARQASRRQWRRTTGTRDRPPGRPRSAADAATARSALSAQEWLRDPVNALVPVPAWRPDARSRPSTPGRFAAYPVLGSSQRTGRRPPTLTVLPGSPGGLTMSVRHLGR